MVQGKLQLLCAARRWHQRFTFHLCRAAPPTGFQPQASRSRPTSPGKDSDYSEIRTSMTSSMTSALIFLSFFRSGYGERLQGPPPGTAQPVLGYSVCFAPLGSKGRWAKHYINMLGAPNQNNNKWSFGECMASLGRTCQKHALPGGCQVWSKFGLN